MIGQAIPHLVPSVEPVTVCAQQAKVALIRSPIAKAVIPDRRSPFIAELLRRVDVVNVENAVVTFPAVNAGTAQFRNQCEFARPITRVLMLGEAVLVPVIFAALLRAKAMLTFATAALTPPCPLPTSGKVAVSSAILPRAILDAILVGLEGLRAVAASHCDRCLFHYPNIVSSAAHCNFDIACKRIEDAQRQGDLFMEGAAA